MNNKTSLLGEYVNFVDNTKKQNKYFKTILFLFVVIPCLIFFFVLFIYLKEYYLFSATNTKN